MIIVGNNGKEIISTNYFESDYAKDGLFFLSWNAGALRILVPDEYLRDIAEMKTGKIVVVSRGIYKGKDALEIMFDDYTDNPYAIFIDIQQTDRLIIDDGQQFIVSAWTKKGKVAEWDKAKYRVVKVLPCLA